MKSLKKPLPLWIAIQKIIAFSNKPLFVTECSEYDPLANTNRYGERGILQKPEKKIKALKINVLYIPEIENFLFQYKNEERQG